MLDLKEFIQKMPKIELHFHLEGAIPNKCIFELIKKYGNSDGINSIDDIKKKYVYRNFSHFIETWHWQSQYLREYDDFTYIAENVAESLIKQNVKYVEASFTPADFADQHGLDRKKITEAIRKGLNKHKNSILINLIYDFNRGLGADYAMEQLYDVIDMSSLGVIGIGLGGQEDIAPAELFKNVYLKAKKFNLRTTIHAGEYAGPESIWAAIKKCKVERIGHCTSAIKDKDLMNYLKENQIHCELNPISNVMTKVINDIEKHPIRTHYDEGLNISINTDDPVMFNTSLCKEYLTLIEKLKFNLNDIKKILEMTIESSWNNKKAKEELLSVVSKYYLQQGI